MEEQGEGEGEEEKWRIWDASQSIENDRGLEWPKVSISMGSATEGFHHAYAILK
jgi:hypothetical protein